jgi:hypothetical protein
VRTIRLVHKRGWAVICLGVRQTDSAESKRTWSSRPLHYPTLCLIFGTLRLALCLLVARLDDLHCSRRLTRTSPLSRLAGRSQPSCSAHILQQGPLRGYENCCLERVLCTFGIEEYSPAVRVSRRLQTTWKLVRVSGPASTINPSTLSKNNGSNANFPQHTRHIVRTR